MIDRSLRINVVNTGTRHESGLPPATIYGHVSRATFRPPPSEKKSSSKHEYV